MIISIPPIIIFGGIKSHPKSPEKQGVLLELPSTGPAPRPVLTAEHVVAPSPRHVGRIAAELEVGGRIATSGRSEKAAVIPGDGETIMEKW